MIAAQTKGHVFYKLTNQTCEFTPEGQLRDHPSDKAWVRMHELSIISWPKRGMGKWSEPVEAIERERWNFSSR